MAEAVSVGLLGFGTIGTGVVKVLQRNASIIEERLGFPLRLVRIADIDLETDRGGDIGYTMRGKIKKREADDGNQLSRSILAGA